MAAAKKRPGQKTLQQKLDEMREEVRALTWVVERLDAGAAIAAGDHGVSIAFHAEPNRRAVFSRELGKVVFERAS